MEQTGSSNNSSGYPCLSGVLSCFVLSVVYVGSLYIWRSPQHMSRDHPSVIKRRFFSVFVMALVSPLSLYFGVDQKFYNDASLWELLGLRWPGLIPAVLVSIGLTMILFLGPIYMEYISGAWALRLEPAFWLGRAKLLIYWRNEFVAPLSEEWTFRACMLPLLLQCFSQKTAIFICPLFFGVAHFHHLVENTRRGMSLKNALLRSCFQFVYTTIFGTYAAFLFVKTGHFAAPFAVHSFCNHMGLPDIPELLSYDDSWKRAKVLLVFVIGLVAWCFLLSPMTNPSWFSNNLFDKSMLLHDNV